MGQKKVILVITKGNWGGAQRYVYDLATGLPKEQYETMVVTGLGRELPEKLAGAGIETITLPYLGRNLNPLADLHTFFTLTRIFWREKPEVVHLNSPKAGGLGALAARLSGVKKIVYTAHGWTFNEPRPWLTRKIIWLASWFTVLLTHTTVTITESEKQQGLRMPWCTEKIKLIRNGLSTPDFLPREIARMKLGVKGLAIGTIAELHRNKGLKYLIKALSKIGAEDWQAVIIGGGEEKNNLEQLITERQLENKIKLVGFIEDAAKLLPAFDIFVLPSLKEGLPYVILEAGLARLPVIATMVGGIPEVISEGKFGFLIPPGKINPLIKALTFLIEHPAWRQELGVNLEQKVFSEYSLARMTKQFEELYL